MIYDYHVVRALKCRCLERCSTALEAITGVDIYSLSITAKIHTNPKYHFCFNCHGSTPQFAALCSRPNCTLKFNGLHKHTRKDYLIHRFPDALWLTYLDLS